MMPCQSMRHCRPVEGTVRPDGSCRWFEADVVAMTCCYPTHTGNELSSCVGGVAERP